MANLWDHPSILATEALTHLEDKLVVSKMCAIDKTSEFSTTSNGWKVGDTVSFRTHGDYKVDEFTSTISTQPIQSSRRSMVIEKHYDISVELTTREMALDLDSFADQVLRPAAYRLAEKIDAYASTKILHGAGLYTSLSLFDTVADVAAARKAATIQQLADNRFALVDLETEVTLLGQEWFNRADSRGQAGVNTLQSAVMGHVMGMDWFASLGFPSTTFTAGTGVGVTVAADPTKNQIGMDTLSTTATTGTFQVGDRIQVAGMRRPLIVKTQTAATATAIPLTEQINELVPAGAAITVIASSKAVDIHGAIFDDRSLAIAFPRLDLPGSAESAVVGNNGINIRLVKDYNINTKKHTMSMDVLVGAFCLDPRRITLVGQRAA
jgi:P22 coat protein - gene protein 5